MSKRPRRFLALVISLMKTVAIAATVLTGTGCHRHESQVRYRYVEKQNMNVPEITAQEAKSVLDADSGAVYLDVRTVGEFDQGRPPGALNIPVLFVDPTTGAREMNERFVEEVQAVIPKGREIVVGCRSGGRSAMATAMLIQAGYNNVVNMAGGFSGSHGIDGSMHEPGWSNLSYPVEAGDAGDRSYDAVRSK